MGVASCPKCQPVVFCHPHQRLLGLLKVDRNLWHSFWGGFTIVQKNHVVWKIGSRCLFLCTRRFSFDLTKRVFCILFPATSSIILRLEQAVTFFLPGLILFCAFMPKQVWMWGKTHAASFWNQHIKWELLRILCASAGGLLYGIEEHRGVGLMHGCRFSSYISMTCYVEVQLAWRGVWSLLDWAHGVVECGDIIKWIHPTGTKKKCSLGVSSCSTLHSLIALSRRPECVSSTVFKVQWETSNETNRRRLEKCTRKAEKCHKPVSDCSVNCLCKPGCLAVE